MSRIADASRRILADDHEREREAAVFGGRIALFDGGPLLPSISFNGIGDDAYEPFAFPLVDPGASEIQFVKTEWKPYDEVVVACLIAARDHSRPDVLTIESDGDWSPDRARGAILSNEAPGAPDQSGPSSNERGFRKNLLLSLLFFLALAIAYALFRKHA